MIPHTPRRPHDVPEATLASSSSKMDTLDIAAANQLQYSGSWEVLAAAGDMRPPQVSSNTTVSESPPTLDAQEFDEEWVPGIEAISFRNSAINQVPFSYPQTLTRGALTGASKAPKK